MSRTSLEQSPSRFMAMLRQTRHSLVPGLALSQPLRSDQCSENRWSQSNGSTFAGDVDEIAAAPRQNVVAGLFDRFCSSH